MLKTVEGFRWTMTREETVKAKAKAKSLPYQTRRQGCSKTTASERGLRRKLATDRLSDAKISDTR